MDQTLARSGEDTEVCGIVGRLRLSQDARGEGQNLADECISSGVSCSCPYK